MTDKPGGITYHLRRCKIWRDGDCDCGGFAERDVGTPQRFDSPLATASEREFEAIKMAAEVVAPWWTKIPSDFPIRAMRIVLWLSMLGVGGLTLTAIALIIMGEPV